MIERVESDYGDAEDSSTSSADSPRDLKVLESSDDSVAISFADDESGENFESKVKVIISSKREQKWASNEKPRDRPTLQDASSTSLISSPPTPALVRMAGSTGSTAGSSLKWISLVVLILQTTSLVLVLRYSRTQHTEGHKYISSTAVAMAEIVKFVTCVVVLLYNHNWSMPSFLAELNDEVFRKSRDTLKVGVPALLYVVQNNLLFLALSKLDAATYQVTYQLKILTTAFFSVTMLSKRLNGLKWLALLLLTAGVALVQLPSSSPSKSPSRADSNSWVDSLLGSSDRLIGLVCVLAACFSSGFAGVYFERILKGSAVSLWMRNLQLAFFSIFGGFFMIWLYDSKDVAEHGFFVGYNSLIWIVVLLQAYGGLVIALVVKYADNILKGFAVSLSIILSSVVSYFVLGDFEPSLLFVLGASIVIASTFLYGYEPPRPLHTA